MRKILACLLLLLLFLYFFKSNRLRIIERNDYKN
jgi:hypothetical protein